MALKYQVAVIESERGWGAKVDSIEEFDTKEEAEKFIEKFNSFNTAEEEIGRAHV